MDESRVGEGQVGLRELSDASFDLDLLAIVTGARRTGKTMAVRELLHRWRDRFVGGTLFCESATLNGDYAGIFPEREIHTTFKEEELRDIMKRQETKRQELGPGKHMWLILFDDMSYSDILRTSPAMQLIVRNGRHRDICCIITAQDIIDVPPSIRSNAELLICSHTIDRRNLEIMHKVWGGMVDFVQFRTMLFQACAESDAPEPGSTRHINAFCVNRQCRSQHSIDYFFYLRCTVGRRTPFGCTDFWRQRGDAAVSHGRESATADAALQPRLAHIDMVKLQPVRSWDEPSTHLCPVCGCICTAQKLPELPGKPTKKPHTHTRADAASARRRNHRRRRARAKARAKVALPAAAPKIEWQLTRSTLEAFRAHQE